ncbi:MAG: sterol desaturase family protein [Acidobacteriota bacterium]
MVNYIALSIPVFFVLIGVEWLVARAHRREVYRLNDSISDLQTGVLQQVLGVFTKVIVFGTYVWVWQATAIFTITDLPASPWWVWVLCFLAVDHQYYWFHRISHESNLPWGAHIVHHSSEEYNLAVALRQGALQPLFSWVFYLPLAWIGFPPLVFLACKSFNTLYQFWIHTRLIGKLGPIEWIFNTPSHHRVHHGCDAKYIDKNYAGTLIVWDRLFGSFKEEEEEPTYGITKPLRSWNPLWANVHYYVDLARLARQAPTWRDRLEVWLRPPAWTPEWAEAEPGDATPPTPLTHGEAGKYDARAPRVLGAYVVLQFVGASVGTLALLHFGDALTLWAQITIAVLVAWTALNLGGLFEARGWVLPSELARHVATPLIALAVVHSHAPTHALAAVLVGVVTFGVSAAWLLRCRAFLQPDAAAAAYS